MEAERQQVRSEMNVSSSSTEEPAKFIPGGDVVYSKYPARPKLWKEPPTRGTEREILLVNTDKTLVPDLIVQEEEDFAENEKVEITQSSTERKTANMIGSGRLPYVDERLKGEKFEPPPEKVLRITPSELRGMAYSAFYAGEFLTSSHYLDKLCRITAGTVDTYLLQMENFVYLGKPSAAIFPLLERFNKSVVNLMEKLSGGSSRYIKTPVPEISLYHLLRWALELRHNNRLHAAMFVCRSVSLLRSLHKNRVWQFDLTYALFVEIALRIMNFLKPEGVTIGEVFIRCLESTFIMLLNRIQVLHPYTKTLEWKRVVGCSNAVAFFSIMTGDYENASRRINLGLDLIARELYPNTILYPDLKVNQAVMHLRNWNFEEAVSCYEEASKAYGSCLGLDTNRREMIDRADRALRRAKELRDADKEARELRKSAGRFKKYKHISRQKVLVERQAKSADQLFDQ